MRQHILDYLRTKPQHKKTIIFSTHDIFISDHKSLTRETKAKRRSLGTWLFWRMKSGSMILGEYVITVAVARSPFKYQAERITKV